MCIRDRPGTVQQHAAEHGCECQQLAETGSGAACRSNAVLAGETTAEKASSVERIGRQQVEQAQARLHPDHTTEKIGGRDPRLIEKPDVSAGPEQRDAQRRGCGATG